MVVGISGGHSLRYVKYQQVVGLLCALRELVGGCSLSVDAHRSCAGACWRVAVCIAIVGVFECSGRTQDVQTHTRQIVGIEIPAVEVPLIGVYCGYAVRHRSHRIVQRPVVRT